MSKSSLFVKSLFLLVLICTVLCAAVGAENKPRFISPNGKYAVRLEPSDEPGMTTVNLIEVKSGAVVCELDSLGHPWINEIKLVWAPDSQRAAFMSASRRGGGRHYMCARA